jgi:hypothetical protein
MVGTAFLLARSSAVLWTSTARPRRPGHELSSRPKNQTTRRSRSAPTASSGPATGRSPLLGVGGLPQGRVRLWRAVAQPPRQRCGPGRRRRRTTAGPRTARPGRIGWQVLVMLARAADRARVTKQYELVCKAEISPFARKGTSGVRGPAASGASQRWPACRVPVEPDPGQDLAGQLGLLLGGDQQHVGQDRVGPSSRGPYRSQVGSSTRLDGPQRLDHLPVAEQAGLGLVRLGGRVQLIIGGGRPEARRAPGTAGAGQSSRPCRVVAASTTPTLLVMARPAPSETCSSGGRLGGAGRYSGWVSPASSGVVREHRLSTEGRDSAGLEWLTVSRSDCASARPCRSRRQRPSPAWCSAPDARREQTVSIRPTSPRHWRGGTRSDQRR